MLDNRTDKDYVCRLPSLVECFNPDDVSKGPLRYSAKLPFELSKTESEQVSTLISEYDRRIFNGQE